MKLFPLVVLLIGMLFGALLTRIWSNRTPQSVKSSTAAGEEHATPATTNLVIVSIYKTNLVELRATNWPYSRHARELALRDERARLSSEKRVESSRDEYAKLFDSIGAAPGTLEKVLPLIANVTQRAFLGEAAILDHMQSQIAFTNELATMLTLEQFKQFVAHEESRLFDMEMARIAKFAESSPISEEASRTVQEEARRIGVYTDGSAVLGPLDPTPQPAAGVDASVEWNRARLKLAESIRERIIASLAGKIPDSELEKVSAYYASIVARRQKAIDDLLEMSKLSTEEIIQKSGKQRRKRE